jgi:peptide/nickel transport system substrate-binding protein
VIATDRPLIYLYHPVYYFGVSKNVTGLQVYGDGLIRAAFAGYAK